ncbi:MAG: hypothetical protein C4576_09095 [Desulfobacteraceae bacterium]|nr:MAG: hypothetical protein C4576_09095 [Desulfobacteraceae bacterium]
MEPGPAQDISPKTPEQRLPEGTTENSIKKMAVLFTDIVASTRYFQTFGDMAGRRMLKDHEAMATPPILEHGGVVVKMLGDSLMAYFFHPWEAVKAAIKIQKRFQKFNGRKKVQEQIHVRIGVHFGDGILEEDDIFGDVVNLAAKFLPFVHGDEIGISGAVLDHIQSIPKLHFETVDIPDKEIFPQGFILCLVNGDEGLDLEPLTKTLVYLKPLFGLGKASFRNLWERLLRERSSFFSPGIEKESVLEDRSLALIVTDPPLSLSKARSVVEHLRLNMGIDGKLFLPVQIIIDLGAFVRADKMDLEDLKITWENIEPGRVYVSAPAYHILKSRGALKGAVLNQGEDPNALYQLLTGEEDKRKDCLFLYQGAIVQGDLPPCFYCGDRRHTAGRCPSKQITESTNAIEKMGYLPLQNMNRLFFRCLNERGFEEGVRPGDGSDLNDQSSWPYYSFFELKSVYQLRLFRAIWNSREEDWTKIREGKGEKSHGGLMWIAQDCIRVSHWEQAEGILKESLAKEPEDYKPLCAMGFLHVEKDDLSQAKFYFKKALDRCQTTPQRIMATFLLSRVCQLMGDQARAEDFIRRVLRYNPHCAEAVYEDILLQFRKGKEAVAIHQLMKLIRKNREYLVYALIDPELLKHRELIHPKIQALIHETRKEATQIAEKAREELADLRRWLGDEERETQDAEGLVSRIEELALTDSFFSYIDILHYSSNLIGIGRSTLEERKRRIGKILKELWERHERCLRYIRSYPYRVFVSSISRELARMHPRISRKWGSEDSGVPNKFKDMFQETERLSRELTEIETRLQRAEVIRRLILFLVRFLKKTLVFQSANLVIAIILFPIVTYYLNLLLPGLNIASQNTWLYQKSVLTLGAVSGLLLAIFTSGAETRPKQVLQK